VGKRELAKILIEDGERAETVAAEVTCHRATVFRYKSNLKVWNDCLAPSLSCVGRPSTLTQEMLDVQLQAFVS
jgi:DNA invertase Pin-like site-specific DNA recombinase